MFRACLARKSLAQLANERGAVGQAQLPVDEGILAQLLDEVDILRAERDVRAEHAQQLLIDFPDRQRRVDESGETVLRRLLEVERDAVRLDDVLLLLQRQRQLLDDARVVNVAQAPLDEVAEVAGRGDDAELLRIDALLRFVRRRTDDALRLGADQAGDLRDDAFGEGA